MVNELKDASGTTPATAGRTPQAESKSTESNTTPANAKVDRAIHFDDFETSDQDSEEDGSAITTMPLYSDMKRKNVRHRRHTSAIHAELEDVRSMIMAEKMREVKE